MERLKEDFTWEGEKVKGSRFIVNLGPVFSSEEANKFLEGVKEKYPDARHHCYAYRLLSGYVRTSDCGEPRGSAGAPILQRLEGGNLVDSIVVVTRYFGGTKLGIGGLIRAYGGATGQALALALREVIVEGKRYELQFSYADSVIVSSVLRRYQGEVCKEQYTNTIHQTVFIPQQAHRACIQELVEKSSNRIQIREVIHEEKVARDR